MAGLTKPSALAAAACRFVLVEDDKLLRELLRDVLLRRCQPKSLRDFDSGRPALDVCLREAPELLITDLRLPDMDGRDIIRRIRNRELATRVVVLTSYVDAVLPAELIAMGVAGLVDKSSSLDHVERAVQSVLAGGLYFAASVSPVASPVAAQNGLTDEVGPAALSERERLMARLVAQGFRAKEIASQLGLKPRTAEKYRMQLMEKLHLPNTTSLVRWCVRHGLD
ncbi:MAG TPA: response regulator transcription factor [Opitutus sp.]|nr:response regulator transcription factor [Opitutus sp.]